MISSFDKNRLDYLNRNICTESSNINKQSEICVILDTRLKHLSTENQNPQYISTIITNFKNHEILFHIN